MSDQIFTPSIDPFAQRSLGLLECEIFYALYTPEPASSFFIKAESEADMIEYMMSLDAGDLCDYQIFSHSIGEDFPDALVEVDLTE